MIAVAARSAGDTVTSQGRLGRRGDCMKSIACKDMGVDCDFVATGETAEEVKAKLMKHAAEAHSDMMAGMSEEETAEMMRTIDEKLAD